MDYEANGTVEVVAQNSAIEAQTRGEIDSQIEIAKKYPRSMDTFKKRALEMACMDEETAASCLYRRPVGVNNGKQEYAEGMSIRMAEIVGASYGNLRVYATLLSQTERQVVARGMAIDLQANFASSSEVVESTVDRYGKPYSERMRAVVAKAALAKARRDATFQVVPKALAKPIEEAVRKLLLGEAKSIESRRTAIAGWISALGIESGRVYSALGINGLDDVGLKEIEILTGLRTAIKDGEVTIDEAFPLPQKEPISLKKTTEKKDDKDSIDKKDQATTQRSNVPREDSRDGGVYDSGSSRRPGADAGQSVDVAKDENGDPGVPKSGSGKEEKPDPLKEKLDSLRALVDGPIEAVRDLSNTELQDLCKGLKGKEFNELLMKFSMRKAEVQ